MQYKPKVGDRVRALLFPSSRRSVEGRVISLYEARGTFVVRDADGDWLCFATGAVPLVMRDSELNGC